jgi:hypothetical protein
MVAYQPRTDSPSQQSRYSRHIVGRKTSMAVAICIVFAGVGWLKAEGSRL